jgi:UPF0271 protein
MRVDLNCDLGEGCTPDAELMPLITSANIACGGHAGTPMGVLATLNLAKEHGVRVGAHPGYPDREHFGRWELDWPADQIACECFYQIGALWGLARAAGVQIRYVKPHGALYNQACRSPQVAEPMVRAAASWGLAVMGLPDSELAMETRRHGLAFIAEGFADRRYLPDGALVPRGQPGAVIDSAAEAAQQALWLIRERSVESICVHGDNPHAVGFVRHLRQRLAEEGCEIRAIGE